jgi:predicted N-acetyltransferase YhbS
LLLAIYTIQKDANNPLTTGLIAGSGYKLCCMFNIKVLSEPDYAFAVEIANTMEWNMATEDFEFMSSLEPNGCFLLLDDTKRVGIATCISYGKVGWFGNLIVKEEYRKRGAGSKLITHAINYMHNKGVETVGLYAYPHLLRFYSELGFRHDIDFSVLHTQNLPKVTAKTLPRIGKSELPAILKFDTHFFGGTRKKLLESIILDKNNTSCYVSEGGEILGYATATVYEKAAWLGPLICQQHRSDIAIALVKSILTELAAKCVYTVIPKKDTVISSIFLETGFNEVFFVSRMFLGKSSTKNCIYLTESLERG